MTFSSAVNRYRLLLLGLAQVACLHCNVVYAGGLRDLVEEPVIDFGIEIPTLCSIPDEEVESLASLTLEYFLGKYEQGSRPRYLNSGFACSINSFIDVCINWEDNNSLWYTHFLNDPMREPVDINSYLSVKYGNSIRIFKMEDNKLEIRIPRENERGGSNHRYLRTWLLGQQRRLFKVLKFVIVKDKGRGRPARRRVGARIRDPCCRVFTYLPCENLSHSLSELKMTE